MDFKKNSRVELFSKAARKITLIAALAAGVTGCATMDQFVTASYSAGGQYGSPTYGQGNYGQGLPRGYQISYQPPRAPWASDPSFQREVSITLQQANNNIRMQYATFQSSMANCNTSYAYAIESNNRQMQYARQNGVSWAEAANSGARINSANATLNYCRVSAETSFQSNYLYQQQSFDQNLDGLNRKYAQRYGVKW